MREKILKKSYIYVTLTLAIILACIPSNSSAMPISSKLSSGETSNNRDNDINKIAVELEKKIVREKLFSLGMTSNYVMKKINELSNEEIHQLAVKVEDIKAAGDAWGAIAAVLILAMIVILVLELLGRRVVSRQ